ncbi:MAG: leucyl aminopeptidase [Actinobacteria bacterium]|nr:leucyl aminopeptidase [Actinomycetota bacterium]
MPTFDVSSAALHKAEVDALVVPVFAVEGDGGLALGPGAAELAATLDIDLAAELEAVGFDPAAGNTTRMPIRADIPASTLIAVGLGEAPDVDAEAVRRAGAVVAAATMRLTSIATTVAGAVMEATDPRLAAQAFVEGVLLGTYQFDTYKAESETSSLTNVRLHAAGPVKAGALKRAIASGEPITDAVVLARDLVNEPSGAKRPPALADRLKDVFKGTGVKVRVLDEEALQKGGYGGLLGVGAGSDAPPRLVELTWKHDRARKHIALVGKGITFDSGGLSLKTSNGMQTMKMDMAGAASVAAAIKAAADLDLRVNITGVCALAENMPSGSAIRPGDVLTIRGGKTVEVLNTDAEGRLVLADALQHASEKAPDAIVDLATLTGAIIMALGPKIGGLYSTDDDLAASLLDASERTGEPLWRMPLGLEEYGEELKGDIADVKNHGWSGAGPTRAALFLHAFVGEGIPWAHLDIAGIAWRDTEDGYIKKGATGAPVRTLVEWLRSL